MTQKATSIARGAAAVAAGAVFGVFAIIYLLSTMAWGINSALSSIWLGFLIVLILLVLAAVGAFLFARNKLKVGPPAPTMAIDEAKKIRETVSSNSPGRRTDAGRAHTGGDPGIDRAEPPRARDLDREAASRGRPPDRLALTASPPSAAGDDRRRRGRVRARRRDRRARRAHVRPRAVAATAPSCQRRLRRPRRSRRAGSRRIERLPEPRPNTASTAAITSEHPDRADDETYREAPLMPSREGSAAAICNGRRPMIASGSRAGIEFGNCSGASC